MFLGNHFYNNWLDCSAIFNDSSVSLYANCQVDLDVDFFKNLKLDKDSCKEYRIEAAKKCAETLGDNIALCISGGVDSQAMLHAFIESGVKFTAYTFVYNNNLNSYEVSLAQHYCQTHRVKLVTLPFHVLYFLTNENYDFGITYKSASPHFNVHYKFCDILRNKGHTGVCFGGTTPYNCRTGYGVNYTKNTLNYMRYSDLNKFPVQGNFLSYYPELTWAISILTPFTDFDPGAIDIMTEYNARANAVRYANKILGYAKAGLDVNESKKLTGFEDVKNYYQNLTGDAWEFEKRFRHPLEKLFSKSQRVTRFVFKDGVSELLDELHRNH